MAIVAQKRTEKEYRALELDSYSSLALFAKDRKQYYRKIFLGEKPEDDDNKAILMGQLVETLLLEGHEEFDRKFYMSTCLEPPTGNGLKFVNALYKRTVEATDADGVIQTTAHDLFMKAYEDANIKKPGFSKFLSDFQGSGIEEYYREMRATRPNNLQIVCLQDIDNAKRIIEELKTNEWTAPIVNLENSERWEIHNQLQIDGFQIDGLDMKSMLDKLIIDHDRKEVTPYDLKCVWNVEDFYENYYLYRKAYIQPFVYMRAVDHWLQTMGYKDYYVNPFKFMVCDSIGYYKPLIYECSEEDIQNGYDGFEYKGRTYIGVKDIIKDVKWAKENNEWRISRSNAESQGIVKLKK